MKVVGGGGGDSDGSGDATAVQRTTDSVDNPAHGQLEKDPIAAEVTTEAETLVPDQLAACKNIINLLLVIYIFE